MGKIHVLPAQAGPEHFYAHRVHREHTPGPVSVDARIHPVAHGLCDGGARAHVRYRGDGNQTPEEPAGISGAGSRQLLAESDKRYRDAELILEVGKIISSKLGIQDLLATIMKTLERYFDFDRGMVLLANNEKTSLSYQAGYGYEPEQENLFKSINLHLDKSESKGPFVLAFRQQQPYLVNDVSQITGDLSERSRKLVEYSGARSFLCVPIVYEKESLGVISLDNTRFSAQPRQSDLNLLMGIAPQIAISIMNARSFERLQASEEKYRDLVGAPTASS